MRPRGVLPRPPPDKSRDPRRTRPTHAGHRQDRQARRPDRAQGRFRRRPWRLPRGARRARLRRRGVRASPRHVRHQLPQHRGRRGGQGHRARSPSPRSSSTSATSPKASSPLEEFLDENGQVTVQPGDIVDVLLERTEDRDGYVVLSREKAEKMKIWDEVEKAYAGAQGRHRPRHRADQGRPRGGHRRARVPARLARWTCAPSATSTRCRGQELRMRVIKVNKKRGNIVLSRKVAPRGGERREEEAHARDAGRGQGAARRREEHHRLRRVHRPRRHRRPAAHHRHVVGPRRPPVARSSRSTTRSTWWCSSSTRRPSASRSASSSCMADPWTTVTDRVPGRRARVKGKVVSLTDYGAFIELEPGVEGLIHVSEMSWSKRVKHPSKILNVGDAVEAMVLGVDPAGAPHLARPQADRDQPVAASWPRSTRSARRSTARSATSPSSARSSRSRRASTA